MHYQVPKISTPCPEGEHIAACEPRLRSHGAAGCARPVEDACVLCGCTYIVGWTSGPVYFTDVELHVRTSHLPEWRVARDGHHEWLEMV